MLFNSGHITNQIAQNLMENTNMNLDLRNKQYFRSCIKLPHFRHFGHFWTIGHFWTLFWRCLKVVKTPFGRRFGHGGFYQAKP